MAQKLLADYKVSQRRICGVINLCRSALRYENHKREDRAVRQRINEIARTRVRYASAVDVLTKELKVQLLNLPTNDVLIDGETSPLMIATQRTAASLAKCYAREQRKIIYPQMP